MNIEIDQSGKVEDTGKNTVIAFSNDVFGTIFISAQEKREVQKFFRKIGKGRMFVTRVFAVLIFLLLKPYLRKLKQIVIDEEYPGKAGLIKQFLLEESRKITPSFSKDDIVFRSIGKKSRAHFLAYGVASGRKQTDLKIGAREILRMITR